MPEKERKIFKIQISFARVIVISVAHLSLVFLTSHKRRALTKASLFILLFSKKLTFS